MSLLGLDVGTTGTKAVAFDLDGRVLASAYREYPLRSPRPGRQELDEIRVNMRNEHEALRRDCISSFYTDHRIFNPRPFSRQSCRYKLISV
jgi:glycerol kinase